MRPKRVNVHAVALVCAAKKLDFSVNGAWFNIEPLAPTTWGAAVQVCRKVRQR
jgi:hypothetical protein